MAVYATVAEVAGKRRLIGLDRGHRLEIGPPGGPSAVVEARPVSEFSAAVDPEGGLHVTAWLLSRQLMYYTSADGETFTRSTLLKSEGDLRLRDPLIFADGGVTILYVAEADFTDTLVRYRYDGAEWSGRRLVEAEHPQRIAAYQFDGAPGPLCALYGVRDSGRTVVMAKPLADDSAPEVVASVSGGLTDFCAMTYGGARQACWISDGRLAVNGTRQPDEAWSRTWPYFRRVEGGVHCLWMENGTLCGMALGGQRARLQPLTVRNALPCMLALPGEARKSVVDGASLKEPQLLPENAERQAVRRVPLQPSPDMPETAQRGRGGELTLTEAVRNQAIYITRMQESLGAVERGMLKLNAEVNRLSRELAAMISDREARAKAAPQFSIATVKKETPDPARISAEQAHVSVEQAPVTVEQVQSESPPIPAEPREDAIEPDDTPEYDFPVT